MHLEEEYGFGFTSIPNIGNLRLADRIREIIKFLLSSKQWKAEDWQQILV